MANCTVCVDGKLYDDFSSNDYLNLSFHPELIAAAKKAADSYGTSSSSSQLITGYQPLIKSLELAVSSFKKKEAALIFNSGYTANLAFIQSMSELGETTFLLDKKVHASLIDGVSKSGVRFQRFKHNDLLHLKFLLEKSRAEFNIIVIDSVYSMDGDLAPLQAIINLKKQFKNVFLYVDEAHGTGVFGPTSRGVTEGFETDIEFIMGTFSKALGSAGAYIACSSAARRFFVNKARSFTYTTALPPSVYVSNLEAVHLLKNNPTWGSELLEKSVQFRKRLEKQGIPIISGCSNIIPIVLGSNSNTLIFVQRLKDAGFWLTPIRTPTVEKGRSRVRITLQRLHSSAQISRLESAIIKAYNSL
jgi:8-amino-7-oxononanoate synthase